MRTVWKLLFRPLIVMFACLSLSFSALAFDDIPLRPYNAALKESSISGISSGAFMSVQFGTAWSSVIKGVGIVAGGPFFCAQATSADIWTGFMQPMWTAVGPCMQGPPPEGRIFIEKADEVAASGRIDPTSNLKDQKIYIFHGFNDAVVAESVTRATADFYRHYLGRERDGNLFYQTNLGAGHAQVLGKKELSPFGIGEPSQKLNACPLNQSPFINLCGYDQAGVILQHIYGALNPPNYGALKGSVKSFSQGKYTGSDQPSALSLGDTGYVYVPKACEDGAACRVHIALHGCKQDAGNIGMLYVAQSGYNAWADTNRIIVLYPQTVARPLFGFPPQNPYACWDWWSYITHDDSYVTKEGRQIQALKGMLDALTAGHKEGAQSASVDGGAARVVVIDISDTGAALAWTPLAGVDGYAISRSERGGDFVALGKISGASFADNGLKPSTAYRWRVSALGSESVPMETGATTQAKPEPCGKPGECPITNAQN